MNERLINNTAFQMALALLGLVKNCVMPEEHTDAFNEFYSVCKSYLEGYQIQMERMEKRLRPMRN